MAIGNFGENVLQEATGRVTQWLKTRYAACYDDVLAVLEDESNPAICYCSIYGIAIMYSTVKYGYLAVPKP